MKKIPLILLLVTLFSGCKKEAVTDYIPFGVSISDGSVAEGNSGNQVIEFDISTDAVVFGSEKVTIQVSTQDGTANAGADFIAKNGIEVSFLPGEKTKKFQIELVEDAVKESDETFSVIIKGASLNAKILDATANGTILNDD